LPGFFDLDPAIRFLGIGSVLDRRHASQAIKLVAGSGYGGYERKPNLDENWIIHWVRGPRTAALLGLPRRLALGDPAVLVPQALGLPSASGPDIGFMPHFESAARGAWRQAADAAGLRLIDPRDPPDTILRAIGRCKLLLSEALHGVIVADALRVPWIAMRPLARVNRTKWWDWADAMDLRPRFRVLPASTASEWAATSVLGLFHAPRARMGQHRNRLDRMGQHTDRLEKLLSERLTAQASQALCRAAKAAPQLSADAVLDRCRSRMLEAVHAMRLQPLRGAWYSAPASPPRSGLPGRVDSAYQLTPIN
jgi:succinoglycan biosynthesis protein ExoV